MLSASSPVNRMLQHIGAATCLVAVLVAGGGHWAVLQTVAWVGMLVDYSGQASLAEAVQMTFDGKHPCPICRKIEQGRKQERRQPMVREVRKLELFCEFRIHLSREAVWWLEPETPLAGQLHQDFLEAPPRPPPRVG